MTQADGTQPTPAQIRLELKTLKPLLERLEATLTASARVPEGSSIKTRFAALAALTRAHEDLAAHLEMTHVALGLPYDEVIEGVTYTAIFHAEDDE